MKHIFVSLGLCGIIAASVIPAFAQSQPTQTAEMTQSASSKNFIKKRYTIHGTWDVDTIDGQTLISFKDDFKTKGGPDLKVYLSPNRIDGLNGQTALNKAVKIGVLKSNKGQQSYVIPEDISLSDYQSVLIQCEAFAVLWGGFNL